jgi:hypothetical protein
MLEHRRRRSFDFGASGLGSKSDPVGHDLEQADVVVGEPARGECADVKDANDCSADQQWHSEQGADPALSKGRIEHISMIDPLNPHWLFFCRNATGEKALPYRDTSTLTVRRFDPPGSSNHKLLSGGIQQQHGGCVGLKELPHSIKQLAQ